jgi:hypothetical protein
MKERRWMSLLLIIVAHNSSHSTSLAQITFLLTPFITEACIIALLIVMKCRGYRSKGHSQGYLMNAMREKK